MKAIKALLCAAVLVGAASPAASAIDLKSRDGSPRRDSLHLEIGLTGAAGSNGAIQPMWSYSQEWGKYSQYSRWGADTYIRALYSWGNKAGWFNVKAGASVLENCIKGETMLHEAFVSGNAWIFNYTLGREAYSPIDQRNNLGMGSYMMSDNARPYWKAGAGIFDYWGIPGTRHWLEIKGGIYLGRLDNEGNAKFTDDVLFHEKFAYARIGHYPVKPYIGLIHSVMMGGTLGQEFPNAALRGKEIPVDFIASFFAKGSQKLRDAGLEGEYFNAAGGHQGMWELGIGFDFQKIGGSVYYQRPFVDATAMDITRMAYCKDILLGASLRFKEAKIIKQVCVDFLTTVWQGGNGPRDPMIKSTGPEKNGELVYICYNDVTPDVVRKYVSAAEIAEWESRNGAMTTQGNALSLITEIMFKGRGTDPDGNAWTWGNRSRYYENDYYPQGWTLGGLSMGYPLMMTDTTLSAIAPGYSFPSRFANVRMQALSVGVCGTIIDALDYRVKIAGSRNFGNLSNQWGDGYYFDVKDPNYYFDTPKIEFYSGLWLGWQRGNHTYSAALCGDFGQMYNAFSLRLGAAVRF